MKAILDIWMPQVGSRDIIRGIESFRKPKLGFRKRGFPKTLFRFPEAWGSGHEVSNNSLLIKESIN